MGQIDLKPIYNFMIINFIIYFILRGVNIEYDNTFSPCRNDMYMAFNGFRCGNGYIL